MIIKYFTDKYTERQPQPFIALVSLIYAPSQSPPAHMLTTCVYDSITRGEEIIYVLIMYNVFERNYIAPKILYMCTREREEGFKFIIYKIKI